MPQNVWYEMTTAHPRVWEKLRKKLPSLLNLGCNPFMLLMTAQIYAGAGGELPTNSARLIAVFVDTLLGREEKRHPEEWVGGESLEQALAALAYAMQDERGSGTSVKRSWAEDRLRESPLECDIERTFYLASSAMLLDTDDVMVRFYHQLLQEYFAARELGRRLKVGEPLERFWPTEQWWKPSRWEQTFILLAGMELDASDLVVNLAAVNPVVAAQCLLDNDAKITDAARRAIVTALIGGVSDEVPSAIARAKPGDSLAALGDPRPGVGVDSETGLPDIVWCSVHAGPFLMGSSDGDEMAYNKEKPQHEVRLPAFTDLNMTF